MRTDQHEARRRVVLLGDSILDNRSYTAPHPSTAEHLARILGRGWGVDLAAQDGAMMRDVRHQLPKERSGATAILSIGGNDATQHIGLLARPVSGAEVVFEELVSVADAFDRSYGEAARLVRARFDRTILCTIYEVPLEPPPYARLARVPLAVLNDRIIRTAAVLGLEVLELRHVCTEPGDFVLQIEPSARGAEKIAEAIASVLTGGGTAWGGRIHSYGSAIDRPGS